MAATKNAGLVSGQNVAHGSAPGMFGANLTADVLKIDDGLIRKATTRAAPAADGDVRIDTTAGKYYLELRAGGRWVSYLDVSDRHVIVMATAGGHYATLAAALAALGDRAVGDEMNVIVASPLTETAQIVAKNGVNVYALPGCPITSTIAGNTDALLVASKSNAEWRGVRFFRAGAPSGTNYAIAFTGTTARDFRLVDCHIENLGTATASIGARFQDTASPTWDRTAFVGGKGTTNCHGALCNLPTSMASPKATRCRFIAGDDSTGGPTGNNGNGLFLGGGTLGEWIDNEYLASPTGSGTGLEIRDPAAPIITRGRAVGGGVGAGVHGMRAQGHSRPRIEDLVARGGTGGINSRAFSLEVQTSAELINCKAEVPGGTQQWSYLAANAGRFQPQAAHPWSLDGIGINVVVATAGATLNIGTTPGGADVVAGASLAAIAQVSPWLLPSSRRVIAAGGYLYATVVGGVAADASFIVTAHWVYAYDSCNALQIVSGGYPRIRGGSYISNPASDALYITGLPLDDVVTRLQVHGAAFLPMPNAAGAKAAIKVSGPTAVVPAIVGCVTGGPVVNVTLPGGAGAGGGVGSSGAPFITTTPGWDRGLVDSLTNVATTPAVWTAVTNSIGQGFAVSVVAGDIQAAGGWPLGGFLGRLFTKLWAKYGMAGEYEPLANNPYFQGSYVPRLAADLDAVDDHIPTRYWGRPQGAQTERGGLGLYHLSAAVPGPTPMQLFAVPYDCAAADLFFMNRTAGTFDVIVNGATTTVTTTADKKQRRLALGPLTAGWMIAIQNQSAANVIATNGISLWRSQAAGFFYGRLTVSGEKAQDWRDPTLPPASGGTDTTVAYPHRALLLQGNTATARPWNAGQLAAPAGNNDAVIFELGVNDAEFAPDLAAYRLAILELAHAARRGKANCSLIWVLPSVPRETSDRGVLNSGTPASPGYGGKDYSYDDFKRVVYDVARELYGAVVDIDAAWGEYALASGYLTTSVHPSPNGHAAAETTFEGLLPVGTL